MLFYKYVISFQAVGAIARVTHVCEINPNTRVHVQFNDENLYNWVSSNFPLPSEWMEAYHPDPATPALISDQVTELVSKGIDLFFHAVDGGDLETIKKLHQHYRIEFDAWKRGGRTALQVACEKNQKELAEWLINEAKVGLNVAGIQGFRAIHYAVQRWSHLKKTKN